MSFILLLFCAAIGADIGGHMPEMRGAWLARAQGQLSCDDVMTTRPDLSALRRGNRSLPRTLCDCILFAINKRFGVSETTARTGESKGVKRILKILSYIAAGIYLLVDAIFMTLARPIANWIGEHLPLKRLKNWIRSLPPYPSLALFSVPVIVLEPIKPLAAYLAATGQFLVGALTFIIGELLKLVLVERLFALTREKLMRIPTFAKLYGWYRQALAWLKATEAWRVLLSLVRSGREYFKAMRVRVVHRLRRST